MAIELVLRSGWQGVRIVEFDDALQTAVNHYMGVTSMRLGLLHSWSVLNYITRTRRSQQHNVRFRNYPCCCRRSWHRKMLNQVAKMSSPSATAERSFSELRRFKTYLRLSAALWDNVDSMHWPFYRHIPMNLIEWTWTCDHLFADHRCTKMHLVVH